MVKLTTREQIVYALLKEQAANGALRTTNGRLSEDLKSKKNMSGFNGNKLVDSAISRFLSALEEKKLIRIQRGKATKDKIIYILEEKN